MAGKRDARPVGRTEGGVEVCFAALAVVHQLGRDTALLPVFADIVDELALGIAARGVECDQSLDNRTGRGPAGCRVGVRVIVHSWRVPPPLPVRFLGLPSYSMPCALS